MEVPEDSSGGDHSSPEKRHSDQNPTTSEPLSVDQFLDSSQVNDVTSPDNLAFLDISSSNNNNNNKSNHNLSSVLPRDQSQSSNEIYIPLENIVDMSWLSPNMVNESFEGEEEKNIKILKGVASSELAGIRCSHCNTDYSTQWRKGPNGPKTLCNACRIRYMTSGTLVSEYRPLNSPSFDPKKHSNYARKVREMRKRKRKRKDM